MARLPNKMRWLFWEMDFPRLDTKRHADYILGRVLEQGRLEDVRWAMKRYGLERIHKFFREVPDPELSARTLAFWRCVFKAKKETWASPPAWRKSSKAYWPG